MIHAEKMRHGDSVFHPLLHHTSEHVLAAFEQCDGPAQIIYVYTMHRHRHEHSLNYPYPYTGTGTDTDTDTDDAPPHTQTLMKTHTYPDTDTCTDKDTDTDDAPQVVSYSVSYSG